jgi:hypothetical protein
MSQRYDPISLEILWNRLISIVDEASAALVRASFSTVLRESNDFACILLDAQGRSLAQSARSIPSFIGTMPISLKKFLEIFPPETLEAETIVLTVGFQSENRLYKELKGHVDELYQIGDCVEPRNVMCAIREGAEIGRLV